MRKSTKSVYFEIGAGGRLPLVVYNVYCLKLIIIRIIIMKSPILSKKDDLHRLSTKIN